MNIGIFVNTPAQVHFYKNIATGLQENGHKVFFIARDYRETLSVLNGMRIPYFVYSKPTESKIGKIIGLPSDIFKAYVYLKNHRTDITLGFGGPEAYTAFLLQKPAIAFQDSEPHINLSFSIQFTLFMPFVNTIITPDIFLDDLGKKHLKVKSFKEMAYLHPSYFKPDKNIFNLLGISEDEEYIIIRFNALDAVHDAKIGGFSIEEKRKLIRELEKYAKVFISAEQNVPEDLEKYVLKIPKHKIHDCLSFAKLVVADTQTMVTEAGILGTPAIRCNSFVGKNDMANFTELEKKYELIFNYRNANDAIQKAIELVQDPDTNKKWENKKKILFNENINLTAFMIWFIEHFPKSYIEMKENPKIQNKFR